jgi:hypothetical protein
VRTLVILAFGILGVLVILVLIAARRPKPHHLTRREVADEIESFLKGEGEPYDWDDFCKFPLADPELDTIRARCLQLDQEFPPGLSGGYCNEDGMRVLRQYVEHLRRDAEVG